MELVDKLRAIDLLPNRDFVWSYRPRTQHYYTSDNAELAVKLPYVEFEFEDIKMLSYVKLRWG